MQNVIGIRRENKDLSERRAALTPLQVQYLITDKNLKVVVEPSANRVFPDNDYQRAGAIVSKNLSDCNIILGVKEIPIPDFLPKKAYCFFSHTIKGQPQNMPMLKHILDLRDTLLDYEKVTDKAGRRLIFFGRYAGLAGMIDSLWALGKRFEWEGIMSPFSELKYASNYSSLAKAKEAVQEIGKRIRSEGLPKNITPLICGFTGYGHVSQGAQEIYDLMPTMEIHAAELETYFSRRKPSNRVLYKVVFKEEDLVEPRNKSHSFNLQHYYHYPNEYQGKFERFAHYLTLIINGIYWDPHYPRLLTKKYLHQLFQKNQSPRLKVIGDITCDIDGSIECNVKATNSTNPVYVYHPASEKMTYGWEGTGVVVLAVDKLPAEIPAESSASFGEALFPFVPALAKANFDLPFSRSDLPEAFRRATIAHAGKLTPQYQYIKEFISAPK